jgi:hypothetical protein
MSSKLLIQSKINVDIDEEFHNNQIDSCRFGL